MLAEDRHERATTLAIAQPKTVGSYGPILARIGHEPHAWPKRVGSRILPLKVGMQAQ